MTDLFEETQQQFEKLKEWNSWVFVEMPKREITDTHEFREWLLAMEIQWMRQFNGNSHYFPRDPNWNQESGIYGKFNGVHYLSKFYRYDGTFPDFLLDDIQSKRGVLIRDHYSPFAVIKTHAIADNLTEFLTQQAIIHKRINRKK